MKTAFDKMKERMGVAAAETLRLDTLRLQEEARKSVLIRDAPYPELIEQSADEAQ